MNLDMMERKGLRRLRAVLALATLIIGALFAVPAGALSAGQVAFADANDDGYVNAAERDGLDSATHSVPVHRQSPGANYEDAGDTVSGSFLDASDAIPANCGPYDLTSNGFSYTGNGEYLSGPCFSQFAEGDTIKWRVTWTDSDDSLPSVIAQDTIVRDTIAPVASVTLAAGADDTIGTAEATKGVQVSWNVDGTGPLVTIRAANDNQASPPECILSERARVGTGYFTAPCFQKLSDGPVDVFVTGADPAGNEVEAKDPNTALAINRVGALNPPAITSPTDGSLYNAQTLKASGSGEPGATIEIWVDKGLEPDVRAVENLTVDANGQWAVTLPARTAHLGFGRSGTYTIYAVALDGLGNPSLQSVPKTFDLDIDLPTVRIDGPANWTVFDHDDPIIISGEAVDPTDHAFGRILAVEIDVFSAVSEIKVPEITADGATATAVACTPPVVLTPTFEVKPSPPCVTALTRPIYRHEIGTGHSVHKVNAVCTGTDPARTPCGVTGPREATWSRDLTLALRPGAYTAQVRSFDIAGNTSAQLAEVNFIKL